MKQVGFRQEAARLGGIGSCGRIVLFHLVDRL
jgi:cell fate regulator YaaT (PSP1 superfamily)